jgi:hypothetical protein
MTRIFFDTEFIEDGRTIELISIGMCMYPSGRELYLVSSEFDESKACPWVQEHVLPHIWHEPRYTREFIKNAVSEFVLAAMTPPKTKPQIWGYYADYDWVALCQLFGRMIDLPKHFPMYALDLKQLVKLKYGDRKLPKQTTTEHHALNDARWVRDMCLMLEPPCWPDVSF